MRPRVAARLLALPACGLFVACTSDLDAPDAYTEPSISAGNDTAGDLDIDCDAFPDGAVGAEYDHTPELTADDDPTRQWSASNLPDGLEIDGSSGQITGIPTAAGTTSVEFNVMDSSGMSTTTCDITVNDGLSVEIEDLVVAAPGCVRPGGDTLLDFVVEGTGDGSAITCDHPGGTGNGRRPAGISVNPETCAIEGSVDEDRQGTWVFIVRGEQSGAEVWVPYCVSNEDGSDYEVRMDHSGLPDEGTDSTLVPILRRFNPAASVAVGEEGDPFFTITDPPSCGTNACFYGFAFQINASPFDAGSLSLSPDEILIPMEGGGPQGFTHNLSIDGPQVGEEFADRPWTVNIALDYCLADSEGPCEGADNIRENGDGNLDISILMVPQ
ncbi:MAG: Ig domain-containing protein [Myxococcota bacterium]